jgi:putative nucleotidyltransferase with HDIG domain
MITKIKEHTRSNIVYVFLTILFLASFGFFCRAAGYSYILLIFLLFLGVHIYLSRQASLKLFLSLGLLLSLIVFTAHIVAGYSDIPIRYIPVAGISILTMLLFNDLHISFLMAFSSSVVVSLILGGDFDLMLTFFIGGLIGAYTVRDARTRGQVMSAGLFVSAFQLICLFLLRPDYRLFLTREFTTGYLYPWAANGFISVFLVIATLKIFEYFFSVLTNYSLLELSDFNQPLLKKMILEAPGTYHHSLVVGNLAEAAADAIGANGLLTRVGAYYHDIGKLSKSEYYTENQMIGLNKHDNMEPSMSRLVILSHVKEGIELGKKYGLNPRIIDFIPQHHGTSLIYYFYQRAVEDAEEGETVDESDFRYPGPKPQTREAAIVLLADSVEGATRALDDPTPPKIEETVKKVVNNKFIDGQLDECNLTLKEIEKISSTFTRILSAMYHARVKYPEKKNGSISRKPSEKNIPQSSPDTQDREDGPSA